MRLEFVLVILTKDTLETNVICALMDGYLRMMVPAEVRKKFKTTYDSLALTKIMLFQLV